MAASARQTRGRLRSTLSIKRPTRRPAFTRRTSGLVAINSAKNFAAAGHIDRVDPSDRRRRMVHKKWDYANCVGHLFLCKFPVLPDRDDRQFCRHNVLIQNMKRIQGRGIVMTIYPTGSPRSCHGEDTGVPNWWHRSAEEARKASGPGKTKLTDPMPWTTDTKTGSSETAGRNRYPRLMLAKESFLPC